MLMDADVGEGGVKNMPKIAVVVYGRSQSFCLPFILLLVVFYFFLSDNHKIDR